MYLRKVLLHPLTGVAAGLGLILLIVSNPALYDLYHSALTAVLTWAIEAGADLVGLDIDLSQS